jgi:hypothetical protein
MLRQQLIMAAAAAALAVGTTSNVSRQPTFLSGYCS